MLNFKIQEEVFAPLFLFPTPMYPYYIGISAQCC